MTHFDETEHPRGSAGRFTAKAMSEADGGTEADLSMEVPARPARSPKQKTYVVAIPSSELGRKLGSDHHSPTVTVVLSAQRKADLTDIAARAGMSAHLAGQVTRGARLFAGDSHTQAILDADVLTDDDVLIHRFGPRNNPGLARLAQGKTTILGDFEFDGTGSSVLRTIDTTEASAAAAEPTQYEHTAAEQLGYLASASDVMDEDGLRDISTVHGYAFDHFPAAQQARARLATTLEAIDAEVDLATYLNSSPTAKQDLAYLISGRGYAVTETETTRKIDAVLDRAGRFALKGRVVERNISDTLTDLTLEEIG